MQKFALPWTFVLLTKISLFLGLLQGYLKNVSQQMHYIMNDIVHVTVNYDKMDE